MSSIKYKDRPEEIGFDVKEVGIIIGSVVENVLKLEKILNPDVIILGVKKKRFWLDSFIVTFIARRYPKPSHLLLSTNLVMREETWIMRK